MRLRLPEERPEEPPTGYKLANPVLSHDGTRAGFAGVSIGGALPYGVLDDARCVYGRRHRSPALRCDCGFYCLHSMDEALALACATEYRRTVLLEVSVLGAYIRFERGMRYARQRVRVARVGTCVCGLAPSVFVDAGWGRTGWRVLAAACTGCAAGRGSLDFAHFARLGGARLRIESGDGPGGAGAGALGFGGVAGGGVASDGAAGSGAAGSDAGSDGVGPGDAGRSGSGPGGTGRGGTGYGGNGHGRTGLDGDGRGGAGFGGSGRGGGGQGGMGSGRDGQGVNGRDGAGLGGGGRDGASFGGHGLGGDVQGGMGSGRDGQGGDGRDGTGFGGDGQSKDGQGCAGFGGDGRGDAGPGARGGGRGGVEAGGVRADCGDVGRSVPELVAEASLMQARLDWLQAQLARLTGEGRPPGKR